MKKVDENGNLKKFLANLRFNFIYPGPLYTTQTTTRSCKVRRVFKIGGFIDPFIKSNIVIMVMVEVTI